MDWLLVKLFVYLFICLCCGSPSLLLHILCPGVGHHIQRGGSCLHTYCCTSPLTVAMDISRVDLALHFSTITWFQHHTIQLKVPKISVYDQMQDVANFGYFMKILCPFSKNYRTEHWPEKHLGLFFHESRRHEFMGKNSPVSDKFCSSVR